MNENEIKSALVQIGNDLRQAERLMFNGKADEAMLIITKTGELFEQVKAAEPQNLQIKSNEQKYSKLKGDIEKRLQKPLTAGGAPAPIVATSAVKPQQIPYDARKPMQDMQNCLRIADRNLQDLITAPVDQKESLMKRIGENIKGAKDYLASAQNEAARKGVGAHPDFDEGAKKIAETEARYATAKSGAVAAIGEARGKAEEVDSDVSALKDEYERLREVFDRAAVPYYNDLEPIKSVLATIEEFEKNEAVNLRKKLDDFSSKYGQTTEDIDRSAASNGYTGNDRPSYAFEELTKGLEKVTGVRKLVAEDLVKKLNEMIGRLPAMHDFSREKMYVDLREWVKTAEAYDSGSQVVKSAAGSVEQKISEDLKALEAKIDAKDWPGNSKGGEADAALSFFRNDKGWGARPKGNGPEDQPSIPLGVSIHGSWSVQATDILGKPTQYGLPAFVAVQLESEQPSKRVRVYDVTLRTKEGSTAEPKPPFESITVGKSFYIRPDKIK